MKKACTYIRLSTLFSSYFRMYLYQFHNTYLEFVDYMEIHMELGDYTYYTYCLIFRCLKRDGSVCQGQSYTPFST